MDTHDASANLMGRPQACAADMSLSLLTVDTHCESQALTSTNGRLVITFRLVRCSLKETFNNY